MPLYEVTKEGLVAFRQLRGGAALYESEIEELLWENLAPRSAAGDTVARARSATSLAGAFAGDGVLIK